MPDTLTAAMKGLNLASAIAEEERRQREKRQETLQDLESKRAHDVDILNRQAAGAASRLATSIEGQMGIVEFEAGTRERLQTMSDVSRANLQTMIGQQRIGEIETEFGLREPETTARVGLMEAQAGAVESGQVTDLIRAGFLPESGEVTLGGQVFRGLDPDTRAKIALVDANVGALREQYQALKAYADEMGRTIPEVAEMIAENHPLVRERGAGILGIGRLFGITKPSEFGQLFGREAPEYLMELMEAKEEALGGLLNIGMFADPNPPGPIGRSGEAAGRGGAPRGPGPLLSPEITPSAGRLQRALNQPPGGFATAAASSTAPGPIERARTFTLAGPPDTGLRLNEMAFQEFEAFELPSDVEEAIAFLIDEGVSRNVEIDRAAAIRMLAEEGVKFTPEMKGKRIR